MKGYILLIVVAVALTMALGVLVGSVVERATHIAASELSHNK